MVDNRGMTDNRGLGYYMVFADNRGMADNRD